MKASTNISRLFSPDKLETMVKQPKTELCHMMTKHGSDKGTQHHNYTLFYDHIFKDRREEPLNVLEIGIGSNNRGIPSNMTGIPNYSPGASIRAWKEYFPNAELWACDIDKDIIDFPDKRITGFYMDQRDISGTYDTFYEGSLKDVEFDIIIDDGLHHFETNINVMYTLLPKLRKGGWYIIEDILDYNPNIVPVGMPYKYQFIKIPNPHNEVDNNLFVVQK
ncbi:class I SAM-dependent methyltransferase [Pirellulaceae bacterium]|jgi:hypothetical protein|nr:class I SAM-dependent methyltransferase [Pirellulaceae bacterium]